MQTVAAAIKSLPLLVVAQLAAASPTLADYVVKMQEAGPTRIIAYCAETSPATREALAEESKALSKKLTEAAAPLVARLVAQNSETIPEELRAQMDSFVTELGQKQLNAIKGFAPDAYCTWLVEKLRSTTTEKLRTTIEDAFARYSELARQKATSSGGR